MPDCSALCCVALASKRSRPAASEYRAHIDAAGQDRRGRSMSAPRPGASGPRRSRPCACAACRWRAKLSGAVAELDAVERAQERARWCHAVSRRAPARRGPATGTARRPRAVDEQRHVGGDDQCRGACARPWRSLTPRARRAFDVRCRLFDQHLARQLRAEVAPPRRRASRPACASRLRPVCRVPRAHPSSITSIKRAARVERQHATRALLGARPAP